MEGQEDIRTGRLSEAEIESNFGDMHPPLERPEALVEADRCYFCFDAPCTTACPTDIDIPGFIQKIRSDNIKGSAQTIFIGTQERGRPDDGNDGRSRPVCG